MSISVNSYKVWSRLDNLWIKWNFRFHLFDNLKIQQRYLCGAKVKVFVTIKWKPIQGNHKSLCRKHCYTSYSNTYLSHFNGPQIDVWKKKPTIVQKISNSHDYNSFLIVPWALKNKSPLRVIVSLFTHLWTAQHLAYSLSYYSNYLLSFLLSLI